MLGNVFLEITSSKIKSLAIQTAPLGTIVKKMNAGI